VELEAELRAGLDSPDGLWWKVGDRLLRVDPPELVRYLLDTIESERQRADDALAQVARLTGSGAQLANIAFNLRQRLETKPEHAKALKEAQEAWDAAMEASP